MKILKIIARCILFFIAGISGFILLTVAWFYATCPVYTFEEPKPFAGENFFNPYQQIDDDGWQKCIFHLHTKRWGGLTDGDNSSEEVLTAYRKLHFDIPCISDYMSINRANSDDPSYIPIYEHGYNIKKTHQLALGARKVVWRDYFFRQNLNQKQHIIDVLKKHSRRIAVNHPNRHHAYLPEDFRYLSGYDYFEVQNGRCISETEWDAALTNGHPAWLIANDDAHNVHDPAILQREVTFVNASVPAGDEILNRLAQGMAFGLHFPYNKQATFEDKERDAGLISFPISIQVHEDTLHVVWQQTMKQIEFIGDNGKLLKTVNGNNAAFYPIRSEDTYVRVKLTAPEGFVYFLNPVIRCTGDEPVRQLLSSIDKSRTFCKRAIILAVLLGTFAIYIKNYRSKKRNL